MTSTYRTRLLCAIAVGLTLLLASCGGGSDDDDRAEKQPATTATNGETTPETEAEAVVQRVAVVPKKAGEELEYVEEAEAAKGDKVVLQTTVGRAVDGGRLEVKIDKGADDTVDVTARVGSESSVARITSASGDIKLIAAHFSCRIGERSVCPARGTKETGSAFVYGGQARRVQQNGPLAIGATVAGGKDETPSTDKPFDAREGRPAVIYLRVAGPPKKVGEPLAYDDSVETRSGEKLIVQARLAPGEGARRLRISIERGPGEKLDVTAKLGSISESAQITAGSSKPIRLVGGRFDCTIARDALCPPTKTRDTAKTYEYTIGADRVARRGPVNIAVNVADG